MKFIKLNICLLTLLLFFFNGFSQNEADSILLLEVKSLKEEVADLQNQVLENSMMDSSHKDAITIRKNILEYMIEVKSGNKMMAIMAILFGLVAMVAIVIGLYQFVRGFDNKIKDMVNKQTEAMKISFEKDIEAIKKEDLKKKVTVELKSFDK